MLQDAARLRWLLLKSVGAFGSGLAWGLAGWGHGFGHGWGMDDSMARADD